MCDTRGLTTKQIRFVEEYCVDFNGTQAAIRAGYSSRNAGKIAYDLLRTPKVKDAIAERLQVLSAAADVESIRILHELKCIAHFNIQDLISALQGGGPADLLEVERDVTAAVSEITIREIPGGERGPDQNIIKLKFHNKLSALELLAKIKRMFESVAPDDADPTRFTDALAGATADAWNDDEPGDE